MFPDFLRVLLSELFSNMNWTFISSLACHWLCAFTTPPANSSPPSTSLSSSTVPPLHNNTDSKNSASYSYFITHRFLLYVHHRLLEVAFLFPICSNYMTHGLWHSERLNFEEPNKAAVLDSGYQHRSCQEIIHNSCLLLKQNKSSRSGEEESLHMNLITLDKCTGFKSDCLRNCLNCHI